MVGCTKASFLLSVTVQCAARNVKKEMQNIVLSKKKGRSKWPECSSIWKSVWSGEMMTVFSPMTHGLWFVVTVCGELPVSPGGFRVRSSMTPPQWVALGRFKMEHMVLLNHCAPELQRMCIFKSNPWFTCYFITWKPYNTPLLAITGTICFSN